MKEKILDLRSKGHSYNEIVNILGCAKSTVSYYCNKGVREKSYIRNKKYKKETPIKPKLDKFKNRKVSDKARDFQRRQPGGGYTTQNNFTYEQLIEKIGDNPKCYLTGRKIDLNDSTNFSLDHIVPVSKGGSNNLENLGISCSIANNCKRNLSVDEFISLCKEILIYNGYKVIKK